MHIPRHHAIMHLSVNEREISFEYRCQPVVALFVSGSQMIAPQYVGGLSVIYVMSQPRVSRSGKISVARLLEGCKAGVLVAKY